MKTFNSSDQQGKADQVGQQRRQHPSAERNLRLYAGADQADS
jgi:hypothetical protein